MATAGILQAQDIPQPFQHEIMEASTIDHSPRARHGRGKHGGSFSKSGRSRALSNAGNAVNAVNEREVSIIKGLNWILRHGDEQELLKLDEDGFAKCSDLLDWQYMKTLQVKFSELQALVENNISARQKFSLNPREEASSNSSDPSDWLLGATKASSSSLKKKDVEIMANLESITLESENIPEVVVFQTTYSAYPLILATGSLENGSGGTYIHCSAEVSGEAEVLIYIDVRKALEEDASMLWFRGEGKASIVTEGGKNKTVPKAFWKKVVGRKNEVGLLWEDGEEVKEVPVGLRGKKAAGGKGMKGRAGKEAGLKRLDAHSEDEELETVQE